MQSTGSSERGARLIAYAIVRFAQQACIQLPFALAMSSHVFRSKRGAVYSLLGWGGAVFTANECYVRPALVKKIINQLHSLCQGRDLQELRLKLALVVKVRGCLENEISYVFEKNHQSV